MRHPRYWSPKNIAALERAQSYYDLRLIAQDVMSRMHPQLMLVSGPISTGGHNDIKKNLEEFHELIKHLEIMLELKGIFFGVFDQTPFEDAIKTIREKRQKAGEFIHYDWRILHEFYGVLFGLGQITSMVFLPGWQESTGAKWEFEIARRRMMNRFILPNDWKNNMPLSRGLEYLYKHAPEYPDGYFSKDSRGVFTIRKETA